MQTGVKRARKRRLIHFLRSRASAIAIFVVVIAVWQYLSGTGIIPSFLLPPPSLIVQQFFRPEVGWPTHIYATLNEILTGFFFGILGGLALAIMITESSLLRRTLLPYIVGTEALPKVAIAPLIYILLGFNDLSRIIMVVLLSFFPIVLSTSTGLVDVDKNLVYLMKTLGAGESKIFYKVRLPNSTPNLFVGLRLGALGAVVGSVISEFVSSTRGLGFLIINAQNTFNTGLAFAAFTLLGLLSMTMYGGIELSAYLLMPWYRKK